MFFSRHNNYEDYYGPNTPGMEYSSAMATASVVLSFLTIFCSFIFYIAVPCGALSILFALLSRGRNRRLTGRCRIALIVSAAGIAASIVTTVVAVRTVLSDPGLRSQLESAFNYYAQEMGLDIEFDDYFGGGTEKEDDTNSVPDDDDLANDYFNRYYGNGGTLPDNSGEALPDDGNSVLPDDGGLWTDDEPYWFGFGDPGSSPGRQQTPSGGEYI